MDNLSLVIEGVSGILQPKAFLLMFFGMLIASIFAAIPGIGVLLFLAVMIPYSITLQPYEAIALLLGIATVSNTTNTFSSVLLAVPGSSGSQATIVDGYPMAQRGEANRAFGAAFTSSALGALFGVIIFIVALPVMKPLVLILGSPELLVLIIWGLSAVAVLGGKAAIKGLIAAALGLGIALIGSDMRTGVVRFTFDTLYLIDGVSVIIIALGIFAIPELLALASRNSSVSSLPEMKGGLKVGIKDTFTNIWLVARCATIGVWVGAMPGLGSSVADWFAYSHAAQSCKKDNKFGEGDVRGVIAPESSNNAKEGGALIPTMLFGIPGSTSFSLILFAFIAVGIQPGQQMITNQMNYLYAMLAVLVLANVMAAALAIGASKPFSKISLLPPGIIFPVTLGLCFFGAFSVSYEYSDLWALMVFSILGWLMKRFGWPRPAFLLAVVLGPQFETYLWLSYNRYGWDWLLRGGVVTILGMIFMTIVLPLLIRKIREYRSNKPLLRPARPRLGDSIFICFLILCAFAATFIASTWPLRAAVSVYVISSIGVGLCLVQLWINFRRHKKSTSEDDIEGVAFEWRNEFLAAAWGFGFLVSALIIGLKLTAFTYPILYMRSKGMVWYKALLGGFFSLFFLLALYEFLIRIVWPTPYAVVWLQQMGLM